MQLMLVVLTSLILYCVLLLMHVVCALLLVALCGWFAHVLVRVTMCNDVIALFIYGVMIVCLYDVCVCVGVCIITECWGGACWVVVFLSRYVYGVVQCCSDTLCICVVLMCMRMCLVLTCCVVYELWCDCDVIMWLTVFAVLLMMYCIRTINIVYGLNTCTVLYILLLYIVYMVCRDDLQCVSGCVRRGWYLWCALCVVL